METEHETPPETEEPSGPVRLDPETERAILATATRHSRLMLALAFAVLVVVASRKTLGRACLVCTLDPAPGRAGSVALSQPVNPASSTSPTARHGRRCFERGGTVVGAMAVGCPG